MPKETGMHNYLQKKSPGTLRDFVEKFGNAAPSELCELDKLFFYLSYVPEAQRPEFKLLAVAVAIKYNNILKPEVYKNLPENIEQISPVSMLTLPFGIAERARMRTRVARLEEIYGLQRVSIENL